VKFHRLVMWMRFGRMGLMAVGLSLLLACAHAPTPAPAPSAAKALALRSSDGSAAQGFEWVPVVLPGKRHTQFQSTQYRGRAAVVAAADRSASYLHHAVYRKADDLGRLLFSWKTRALIEQADMAVREADDAVVRVILSFEGDRSKFSAKNRMLSELSAALTGQELPYATLMYVWCNKRQVGEIITNPRTDRIRKRVVESGPARLGQWLDYERDIRADFIAAFGEEPGALTGIALMTDTDNTQSQATAWYGSISFKPAIASAASPAR
jgi:hypothetical protein